MSPEVVVVQGRPSRSGIADEAAGSVRVHAEQEWDEEVVSVPERLERLLTDPVMGGRIDHQHAEQHDVTSDSTSFSVVNLESDLWADLNALDVEEADAVSCGVFQEAG